VPRERRLAIAEDQEDDEEDGKQADQADAAAAVVTPAMTVIAAAAEEQDDDDDDQDQFHGASPGVPGGNWATTGAKVADARFENNPAAKIVAFQKP
jgi:hypothetical protein